MGPSTGASGIGGFLQGTPWAGRGRTRPALGWRKAVGHGPEIANQGGHGWLHQGICKQNLTWQDTLYFSPLAWEKVITSAPGCGMGLVVNSGSPSSRCLSDSPGMDSTSQALAALLPL